MMYLALFYGIIRKNCNFGEDSMNLLFEIITGTISGVVSGIAILILGLKFPQKLVIEHRYSFKYSDGEAKPPSSQDGGIYDWLKILCIFIEGMLLVLSCIFFVYTRPELSTFDNIIQGLKLLMWCNLFMLSAVVFLYIRNHLFKSEKKYLLILIVNAFIATIYSVIISWELHIPTVIDAIFFSPAGTAILLTLTIAAVCCVATLYGLFSKTQYRHKSTVCASSIMLTIAAIIIPILYQFIKSPV